jgi:hypothetical protein
MSKMETRKQLLRSRAKISTHSTAKTVQYDFTSVPIAGGDRRDKIQSHARTDGPNPASVGSGHRSSTRRANRCRGARQLSREPRARSRKKWRGRARATQWRLDWNLEGEAAWPSTHRPYLCRLSSPLSWSRAVPPRRPVRSVPACCFAIHVADATTGSPSYLVAGRRVSCRRLPVWCEHGRTSGFSSGQGIVSACDRARKESSGDRSSGEQKARE